MLFLSLDMEDVSRPDTALTDVKFAEPTTAVVVAAAAAVVCELLGWEFFMKRSSSSFVSSNVTSMRVSFLRIIFQEEKKKMHTIFFSNKNKFRRVSLLFFKIKI